MNSPQQGWPQNFIEMQRDYLLKIMASSKGMKMLVLDDFTIRALSLVYMQSEGFKQDVYLFENIKNLGKEKLMSLEGVFVIQPSKESIQRLQELLQNPVFKQYHICSRCVEDKISLQQWRTPLFRVLPSSMSSTWSRRYRKSVSSSWHLHLRS